MFYKLTEKVKDDKGNIIKIKKKDENGNDTDELIDKVNVRTIQYFNKFELNLSDTKLKNKRLSSWKTGGLINEIKTKKIFNFKSFKDTQISPSNHTGWQYQMYGPQHPDQGAWVSGAGKIIHLLYQTALAFPEYEEQEERTDPKWW